MALLFACQNDSNNSTSELETASLLKASWLNNSLPQSTIAYVRIPSPWFLLSGQDNGFYYAQSNVEHNQQIANIRKATIKTFANPDDPFARQLLEFFALKMESALEVAVVNESLNQGVPAFVVATHLNYEDLDSFNTDFNRLLSNIPGVSILQKTDAQGKGQFLLKPMNAHYHFDKDNGRFSLLIGMLDLKTIQGIADSIKPNSSDILKNLELQIDSSGQGLFLWASVKDWMPLLEQYALNPEISEFKSMGLDKVRALAAGYGSTNNKTRLRVIVDMPREGIRAFIPEASNKFSLKSVGEPQSFALLSIPPYEQVKTIIRNVALIDKKEPDNLLKELDGATQENFGLSMKDLFQMAGPEVVYFRDTIGSFYAYKVSNKDNVYRLVERMEQSGFAQYKVVEKNGHKIHHLAFSFMNEKPSELMSSSFGFYNLLTRMKSHIYWIEEGDFFVSASVPQLLLERLKKSPSIDLQTYVQKHHGQNLNNALLAINGNFKDLSRSSYHYYLEALMLLAEISDAEFDIFALPTADQLGFSDYGTLGFQIDSSPEQLAIEFTFEQSISDLFLGVGSVQSVAVVGVLAAVAIPAYQDYVIRAKVSSALTEVSALKVEIAEMIAMGIELSDIDNGQHGLLSEYDYATDTIDKIQVKDGVITIFLHVTENYRYGETVVIKPDVRSSGDIIWSCSEGNLSHKYRPASC